MVRQPGSSNGQVEGPMSSVCKRRRQAQIPGSNPARFLGETARYISILLFNKGRWYWAGNDPLDGWYQTVEDKYGYLCKYLRKYLSTFSYS